MAIGMYDGDYESPDDPGVGASWTSMMNWAGALVSLALIGGLAVWGYQIMVRDVTGVPVVQALEGPMRVAPENPGGEQAEYQDLTVTRVAEEGAAEAPTERVVLAPPPVKLIEEDAPTAVLEAEAARDAAGELADPVLAEAPAAPDAEEPKSAIELAIAEALAGTETADPAPTDTSARVTPALAGGLLHSPAPRPRPAVIRNAVATSSAVASDIEIAVAEVPAGTRLVQLGAFPSAEEARAAWSEFDARFDPYFDDKQRIVQEATAGGSTFYRLRAMGFDDLSDARRFCAVLVAENANCIPVIRR